MRIATIVLMAVMASAAHAETWVGPPSQDITFIRGAGNQNLAGLVAGSGFVPYFDPGFGSHPFYSDAEFYFKFVTPVPHGAKITSAVVTMHQYQWCWAFSNNTMSVWFVDEFWTEMSSWAGFGRFVSKLNFHTGLNVNRAPNDATLLTLDVAPMFETWANGLANHGIAIIQGSQCVLDDKIYDGESGHPPSLTIAWDPKGPGDANKDGAFNQFDIIQVLAAGKYATGEFAMWTEGDWNGDHVFDQFDIVLALQAGTYQPGDAIIAFYVAWPSRRTRPDQSW